MEEKAVAGTRGARAIRRALIELLDERDYADITVGDIIRRSAYSKSCFYEHYCDKLDAAEQTVQEEAAEYVAMLICQMQRYAEIQDEQTYHYKISLSTFEYIEQRRIFYRLLFAGKFPGMDLEYFCALAVAYFQKNMPFQQNVSYTPQELEMFNYCCTHKVMRYIRFWELHGFADTPEEMAARVVTLAQMEKPGKVFSPKTRTG